MLWLLGLALSFAGLCVWLEFGCMFPRSGGEKVNKDWRALLLTLP